MSPSIACSIPRRFVPALRSLAHGRQVEVPEITRESCEVTTAWNVLSPSSVRSALRDIIFLTLLSSCVVQPQPEPPADPGEDVEVGRDVDFCTNEGASVADPTTGLDSADAKEEDLGMYDDDADCVAEPLEFEGPVDSPSAESLRGGYDPLDVPAEPQSP